MIKAMKPREKGILTGSTSSLERMTSRSRRARVRARRQERERRMSLIRISTSLTRIPKRIPKMKEIEIMK